MTPAAGVPVRPAQLTGLLIVLALGVLMWAQAAATWVEPSTLRAITIGWLPAAVAAALVAIAAGRSRHLLAAGVLTAVAPSVVAQLAVADAGGAVAVLAIVAAVVMGPLARRSRDAAVALGASVLVVGLARWWRSTPVRESATTPSWDDLMASLGNHATRVVGSLGPDRLPAPTTAVLAWWFAVAAVAAAALLAGRRRVVAILAMSLAGAVVASIAIERWRGPVDPAGGTFLVAAGVTYAAARIDLADAAGRRIANAAVVAVGWAWTVSTAAVVRYGSLDEVAPPAWHRWHAWGSGVGGPRPAVLLVLAVVGGLAVWGTALVGRRPAGPTGVNVVGYHTITAGLGDRARELASALDAAGVPIARVDLHVESARENDVLASPDVRYASTVVVAPAFEVPSIVARLPELFIGRRLVAGYWFWELEDVPPEHRAGLEAVDEVWAPSRFIRDAYERSGDRPVRLVPLPIPAPAVASLGRGDLGLDADEVVFLVSFSHLSVMERKHPLGAIEAFRRAFPAHDPTGGRVRLVIKTLNHDLRPEDADRLAEAARLDDRITIRPGRMEHGELMALVRAADVLVSLHRSEGLGLHLAEAMWLGTPIIATDYSGSRDLLDETCAELVPYRLVPVTNGDGAYPETAVWADADLDAAAAAMRRLAADPRRRDALAAAARRRIEAQPSRIEAGRLLAKLARCAPSR